MKRILIFSSLKIVEISGFCIICYLLSLYGYWIDSFFTKGNIVHDVWGFIASIIIGFIIGIFLPLILLVILISICYGIYLFILKNWEWSNKITK